LQYSFHSSLLSNPRERTNSRASSKGRRFTWFRHLLSLSKKYCKLCLYLRAMSNVHCYRLCIQQELRYLYIATVTLATFVDGVAGNVVYLIAYIAQNSKYHLSTNSTKNDRYRPYTYRYKLLFVTSLIPHKPVLPSGISHSLGQAVHFILPLDTYSNSIRIILKHIRRDLSFAVRRVHLFLAN
jgi:hypothetical protein